MAKSNKARRQRNQRKGKKATAGETRTNAPADTFWSTLSPSKQHLICGLFLLVVGIGFMSPLIFGSSKVAGQDAVQWRAMAESVLANKEATGEWTMWATNPFGGMPAYMITYPHSVPQLDALVRATWKLWGSSVQFLVLLFGTYLLAFFLTKRPLASTLAAIVFGLTASIQVLITIGHNSKFVALSWAPWLILAFLYVLRRPKLLSGLLFAAILAVAMRAGHVQIVYYAAFACGIIWIVEGVASIRNRTHAEFVKATLLLVLGLGLALVMVAHPFLAQWEYKAYTIRGDAGGGVSGLDWDYAMAWSQGWKEMLTLLISDAAGGSSRTGLYWGPKTFTEGPHYVGGIALVLSVIAVASTKKRLVWTLGGITVLFGFFALGSNAAFLNRPMYSFFPLFDAFRAPSLWLHLVELMLAILAGLGAASLYNSAKTVDLKRLLTIVGSVLAIVVLLMVGRNQLFDFSREGEEQRIAAQIAQMQGAAQLDQQIMGRATQITEQLHDERSEVFRKDAFRTALGLALFLVLLFLLYKRKIGIPLVLVGLVLMATVDLWGVGRRYFNKDLLPTRTVEEQVPEFAYDTFLTNLIESEGGPGRFRVLELRGGLTENARPAYFYETLSGYHAAKLRVYQDYLEQILVDPASGRLTENGLDLTSVRFVVSQGALPGTHAVFNDEQAGMQVYERPDTLPRAYLVGDYDVSGVQEETWQQLRDDSFDPRSKVILAEDPAVTVAAIDSQSTASVDLLTYGSDEIVWQVETDQPRILVVQDVYYPAGWHATVSEQQAPILQANHFQRAVVVPPGNHVVRMVFSSDRYRLGILLSWIGTLLAYGGVLILLGAAWWKRRS